MSTEKDNSNQSIKDITSEAGTEQDQVIENAAYRDRKVGLVIYGVVQIIIGALCALFVPLMIMGMFIGAKMGEDVGQQLSPRMMIPSLLFYIGAAVWFVWMGIGSIRARRWARALNLVTSWLALLGGLAGITFWIIFSPQIYEQIGATGDVPIQTLAIMRHVTTLFLTVIYIIGPGAFILFFRSRHVKATCEARDPMTRWTDRCPLPVLALVIIFASWGLSGLFMGFYNFTMPFFGTIVSGGVGALACLGLVVMGCWTAWGAYKLKPIAWWMGMLLSLFFCVSSAITFSRVSLMEYYEAMDFPEDQIELMRQMDISTSQMMVPMIVTMGFFLGYLLYTKRYFRSESSITQ